MEKITLQKHGVGYIAFQESNPKVFEYGRTRAEAVFQFCVTLGLVKITEIL